VGRSLNKNDLFFAHIIDSNVTKVDLMKLLLRDHVGVWIGGDIIGAVVEK
jgi:hypothetical protein